jgi:hypothetical protein
MSVVIAFVLSQFPILMTALAMLLGFIHWGSQRYKQAPTIFLGYLLFFAVGLAGLWGFIYHAFFPEMTARFIGWANSPFQFEVAMANLGLGVVGIFGFRASHGYRVGATLFTLCFLWGAAYGHIHQMLLTHNFASGNAGSIFYNDLLLPLLLVLFLINDKKDRR